MQGGGWWEKLAKEKGGGLSHTSSYQNIKIPEEKPGFKMRDLKNTNKLMDYMSCFDSFLFPINTDKARI